jgi:hypothetical protein
VRQVRKENIGWNKAAMHYTPQLFEVVRAIRRQANFVRRDEYILNTDNGDVEMSGAAPKLFLVAIWLMFLLITLKPVSPPSQWNEH